jgi:uncharacterized protein (DUF1697 family)
LPFVVFIRGVNVGGHKVFRPSVLATQLADLGVVSVGAVGTFVVRADADLATIRRAFLKRLPFDAQLMICPARDVIDFVDGDPFSDAAARKADAHYVCVLEQRLRKRPRLPFYVPEGRDWQVGVTAIHGQFVAALFRRVGKNVLYPNQVVEKWLGVATTTRGWPTLLKVRQALEMPDNTSTGRKAAPPRRSKRV